MHISYREGRMRDEKLVRERKKEDVRRGGERGRVCKCASTRSVAINTQGPRAKYRLTQLFNPRCYRADILLFSEENHRKHP